MLINKKKKTVGYYYLQWVINFTKKIYIYKKYCHEQFCFSNIFIILKEHFN